MEERLTTDQAVAGSSPATVDFFLHSQTKGETNPSMLKEKLRHQLFHLQHCRKQEKKDICLMPHGSLHTCNIKRIAVSHPLKD